MRIFFLVSRIPYPLEKGDKLRAYLQLEFLSQNHDVHLCCLNDSKESPNAREELKKVCSSLSIHTLNKPLIGLNLLKGLFTNKPFQVHYFFQDHIKRRIQKEIEEFSPDHIFCQLIRGSEYVKDVHQLPKTLDYMDAFSKGAERRKERASFFMKPLLKEESRRLTTYENLIFEYFDQHTIISEQDRKLILHPKKSKIRVIPNGIDTEWFHPVHREKEYDLLFTGNMSYPPNVESARYLALEILPAILEKRPGTNLLISGVHPSRKVKELENEYITVTGWVPDLRESYAKARVFIAPMILGSGLQNKLLEAMAIGIPCITSELANNALGAKDGESILIGGDKNSYRDKALELLDSKELRDSVSQKGIDFIQENFSIEKTGRMLEDLLKGKMTGPSPEGV